MKVLALRHPGRVLALITSAMRACNFVSTRLNIFGVRAFMLKAPALRISGVGNCLGSLQYGCTRYESTRYESTSRYKTEQ